MKTIKDLILQPFLKEDLDLKPKDFVLKHYPKPEALHTNEGWGIIKHPELMASISRTTKTQNEAWENAAEYIIKGQ